jgi:hypothetical protein
MPERFAAAVIGVGQADLATSQHPTAHPGLYFIGFALAAQAQVGTALWCRRRRGAHIAATIAGEAVSGTSRYCRPAESRGAATNSATAATGTAVRRRSAPGRLLWAATFIALCWALSSWRPRRTQLSRRQSDDHDL